jgi:Ni/Co efflux regulator RcnB
MTKILKMLPVAALSLTLLAPAMQAQDHQDHQDDHRQADQNNRGDEHNRTAQNNRGDHYVRHDDWKAGHRMNHDDWARGQRVDYRQRHLPAPRRGYEWRQVDGNYVMAAVATGLIASVVAASTVR